MYTVSSRGRCLTGTMLSKNPFKPTFSEWLTVVRCTDCCICLGKGNVKEMVEGIFPFYLDAQWVLRVWVQGPKIYLYGNLYNMEQQVGWWRGAIWTLMINGRRSHIHWEINLSSSPFSCKTKGCKGLPKACHFSKDQKDCTYTTYDTSSSQPFVNVSDAGDSITPQAICFSVSSPLLFESFCWW